MAKSTLLRQVRNEIRRRNYSYRTEQARTRWIIRLIRFCGTKHPAEITPDEITGFLNHHLAGVRNVAASTQNQACLCIFV